MSIYTEAVQSITKFAESRQAELDQAALIARQNCIKRLRELAVEGVDKTSPAYPVCFLVSQTLEVGREDGYPAVTINAATAVNSLRKPRKTY